MGALEAWDWRAGFAELQASFGPARGNYGLDAAGAVAVARRALHLAPERVQLLQSRAEPVEFTAPGLGSAGRPVGPCAAWVVLILVRRLPDAALPPGDALGGFPAAGVLFQAVVRDDPPEFLVGTALPVDLAPERGH